MKKALKIIGITLLSIAVIYLGLCVAGPADMDTEKSTVINASDSAIFVVVSDFNTWASWDPFNERDKTIKSTITGTPGQLGHKNSWTSKDGPGTQEVVEITPYSYVRMDLILGGSGTNTVEWKLDPADAGTKVTWSVKGNINFMMRGMFLVIGLKGQMSESFERGLSNLKNKIEG